MVSYSPDTTLIAEHLTEAVIVTSFSRQANCPIIYDNLNLYKCFVIIQKL